MIIIACYLIIIIIILKLQNTVRNDHSKSSKQKYFLFID